MLFFIVVVVVVVVPDLRASLVHSSWKELRTRMSCCRETTLLMAGESCSSWEETRLKDSKRHHTQHLRPETCVLPFR